MLSLRKCRMVEGLPGKKGYLTAIMSVLCRQAGRFFCVSEAAFPLRLVLAIAVCVTE